MKQFKPIEAIFRKNSLEYPLGQMLFEKFTREGIKTRIVASRGSFSLEKNISFQKKFIRAKRTLIIAKRSLNKFESCKPSAHYQLPLVSGCPAHCHYCYLSTNLGNRPYIKIYVNLEEIYAKAKNYIKEREPEITVFEGSATSDPLPVEKWTGSLAKTIRFFAKEKSARFRFVTKFTKVDSLLYLDHKKKTEFRFSINSKYVIKKFEPTTPKPAERIAAASKVFQAGYPLGFLIAPIFIYEGWQKEYVELIKHVQENLNTKGKGLTFELITHRFTKRAKDIIEKIYPKTELPMNEKTREFKYGQFGYGKYVYPKETRKEMENFLRKALHKYLPEAEIKYFV